VDKTHAYYDMPRLSFSTTSQSLLLTKINVEHAEGACGKGSEWVYDGGHVIVIINIISNSHNS
jgi:hypothetical protein